MKTIETAVTLQSSPELPELLQIAKVYEQYLKDDEISDEFRNVVAVAKKIAQSGSNEKIKKAAGELLQAVNIFHEYIFMPEKIKTKNIDLIKTLSINGAKCAYEARTQTFYFPVGTAASEKVLEFNFNITSGFDIMALNIKLAVFAEIIDSNGNAFPCNFIPELNKEYILRAYSENFMFDYKIMFTMLPIVQVSDISTIHDGYDDCIISVIDPDFTFSSFDTSMLYYDDTAQIHIRGSSARQYPKKSYAVKFVDENKNDKAVSFFGIEKDSHWILDAMYNDMARMRNRVSTDLWLAFSSPLYYEHLTPKPVYNGTQGGFVELFINDEYMGLYCLTTKINRNRLQLKKYDTKNNIMHGVSYKGKSWDEPLRFKSYHDYNNINWWASFQQKYPNPENGLPVDWEPLYNFIKFVVDSDDETFRNEIGNMIDVNNFVDYAIFLCFSYAHDNTGKNLYFSVYDVQEAELSKFFITVWDVKSTWGRSWNPKPTAPDLEWMDSNPGHDTEIFRRLILTNANGFADKLRARWEEVKVGAFSPEAVKAQFIKYFDLFEASGAFEREEKRWRMGLDLSSEREYILNWIDSRYTYINDFIMNKLDTVGDFAPQNDIS